MGMLDIFRPWPCRVLIAEVRENAIRWDWDKARVVGKEGMQSFHLKKRKKSIPVSKFKQLQIDRKGKSVLTLLNPQLDKYVPLNIDLKKVVFNPSSSPEMWKDWGVLETRRAREIYKQTKGFWEKYAPYLIILATLGVLAFTVIYVVQSLESIAAIASSAGQPLAQAVDRLATLLEKTAFSPQPGA